MPLANASTGVTQNPLPTVIYCHQVGHQYKWICQHTCKKLSKSQKEKGENVRMRAITKPSRSLKTDLYEHIGNRIASG